MINGTEGVKKMICLFKNVHETNEEVIGLCASVGDVCSLESYRNNTTIKKQLGCECVQNIIPNIDKIIDNSLGKFRTKFN